MQSSRKKRVSKICRRAQFSSQSRVCSFVSVLPLFMSFSSSCDVYLFRERKKESNRNYAGSREGGGLSVKYLGCRARWHKFRTRCKIVLVKLACPQKEESRKKLKSSGSIRFREEEEGLHTYGIFMMFTLFVSLST